MQTTLHVLAILLVSLGMGLALAHALEYPGKLRLSRDQYFTVQRIYRPGFALGGVAEIIGLLAIVWLMLITPRMAAAFWLIAGAFITLLLAHLVYWRVTFPTNAYWLDSRAPGGAGTAFLGQDWETQRDRWELSHVARAILIFFALAMLTVALSQGATFISPSLADPELISPVDGDLTLL